ncbi:MAG: hypothetical protein J7L61_02455, partial [Thermoplasmata archaeon]|nr:hypothetical protein [Thermoplasmata archaeon]
MKGVSRTSHGVSRVFAVLLLACLMAAPLVQGVMSASPEDSTTSLGPGDTRGDYPLGYTHRPLVSMFTSLSCPPCMANADPAYTQYWNEYGYMEGQPVNLIVFHLHAGGAKDDPLYTEEGSQWADHQNIIGTPTILVDGGYREPDPSYEDIKSAVEDAGNREGVLGPRGEDFKVVEVRTWSQYNGDSFTVKVWVHYVEKQGGRIIDMNSDLNALINVAMVEDLVDAYSSDLEENVTCYNVFRGFAAQEDVTLSKGDEWTQEYTWQIPELDPEVDNVVPIDPFNVFPVVVVYDKDDTTSGGANGWPGATRCVNSATPRSTMYDMGTVPPEVENVSAVGDGGGSLVEVSFSSPVAKSFLFYNTVSEDYNGTWKNVEMNVSEDGLSASVRVPVEGKIFYRVLAYDGEMSEIKTDASAVVPGGAVRS